MKWAPGRERSLCERKRSDNGAIMSTGIKSSICSSMVVRLLSVTSYKKIILLDKRCQAEKESPPGFNQASR